MEQGRGKGSTRTDKKKKRRSKDVLHSFTWLKKSFEYRGKASARKLTVFFCFVLLNIGFIVHLYTSQPIQTDFIIIYSLIILLGLGFMTAENIVAIVKGRFGGQNMFIDDYDQEVYNRNKVRPDNPDEIPN